MQKFPQLKSIEYIYDKTLQKSGIDKIIHLENSDIAIDEKIEKVVSNNFPFEVDGWINDNSKTDMIVDYKINMNKVYFIPYHIILKMYNDEKLRKEWIERNLERTVLNNYKNNVYKTIIYIVPINEIYQYENLDMKKYTIELENAIENPQKNA